MKTKIIKKKKKESYIPSKYLRDVIARGEKEYKKGKTIKCHNVEELIKSLRSSKLYE